MHRQNRNEVHHTEFFRNKGNGMIQQFEFRLNLRLQDNKSDKSYSFKSANIIRL